MDVEVAPGEAFPRDHRLVVAKIRINNVHIKDDRIRRLKL